MGLLNFLSALAGPRPAPPDDDWYGGPHHELSEDFVTNSYAGGDVDAPGDWYRCTGCLGEGAVTCGDCLGAGVRYGYDGLERMCHPCQGNGLVDCMACEGHGGFTDDYSGA